ncbi:MAG: hypothetical protein IK123_03580, partial [Lachnospiraceae bacterium]|nr:hypothetical protein [Lachnospiraceae bacterium]
YGSGEMPLVDVERAKSKNYNVGVSAEMGDYIEGDGYAYLKNGYGITFYLPYPAGQDCDTGTPDDHIYAIYYYKISN